MLILIISGVDKLVNNSSDTVPAIVTVSLNTYSVSSPRVTNRENILSSVSISFPLDDFGVIRANSQSEVESVSNPSVVLCHEKLLFSKSSINGVSSIRLPVASRSVIVSPKSLNQKLTCVKAANEFASIIVPSGISYVFQVAEGDIDHPLTSMSIGVGL